MLVETGFDVGGMSIGNRGSIEVRGTGLVNRFEEGGAGLEEEALLVMIGEKSWGGRILTVKEEFDSKVFVSTVADPDLDSETVPVVNKKEFSSSIFIEMVSEQLVVTRFSLLAEALVTKEVDFRREPLREPAKSVLEEESAKIEKLTEDKREESGGTGGRTGGGSP